MIMMPEENKFLNKLIMIEKKEKVEIIPIIVVEEIVLMIFQNL